MNTYLIIGKSFSGLKQKITSRGEDFVVLLDTAATKYPDKERPKTIVVDFSEDAAMKKVLEKLRGTVDAVLVTYENYILSAAKIANELGLPGMPVESAKACTDKYIMRDLFANAPIKISPSFADVTSWEDVESFAKKHSFPLMLKPANLAKSLLVTKNSNSDELRDNYTKMMAIIDKTYKKYAPGRQPRIIIEEFMEGPIHSVDAFIDGSGNPQVLENIVDYQTGYDIGFDDNFHYSRLLPSKLSEDEAQKLRTCAEVGIRSLGMRFSAAHVEIIRTKDGPRIVEIGARNGGYRDRMHALANGIDILGTALNISLGQSVSVKATKNEPCAVLEIFPKNPGAFDSMQNWQQVQKLDSFVYGSIKATPGNPVGKSSEGYKACAIVILHNKNEDIFNKDLAFVDQNVFAKTVQAS